MFKKIKQKKIELFSYVMIIFISIIALFGGINIYNSCKVIKNQASSNLIFLVDNVRKSVNKYFHISEAEVEHCKEMITLTIDNKKLNKVAPIAYKYNKNKIPYVRDYLNSIVSPVLLYSTKNVEGLMSIYFIFDYKLLKHKDVIGLWYVKPNHKDPFKSVDNGLTSTMLPENRSDLEWFYMPKNLKKGVWSKPYIDDDLKIDMITYSTPVYSNKTFIGIAGMDISIPELMDFFLKFKIYQHGNIYLIDKNNEIIYAKGYKPLTSTLAIDETLHIFLDKYLTKDGIKLKDKEIKLIRLQKKLFAITPLYNGFILVAEVPTSELYGEVDKLVVFAASSLILSILIVICVILDAYIKINKINNELIHKEKLISMGKMAAEIAHEINNPLSYIKCNIDTLKKFLEKIRFFMLFCKKQFDRVAAGEITLEKKIEYIDNLSEEFKINYILDSLDEIVDESKDGIKRVSEIVANLKTFAKEDSQDAKSLEDLEKMVEYALNILNSKVSSEVKIIKNFEKIPLLLCNRNQIEQVLVNIIDNAYYSVKEKGHENKKIIISIYKKDKNGCIEIEDNGIGIEKNKIHRVFETFFTTKDQGKGTGLGLSIVYEIITNKHNGEILVESKEGKGAKFTIKIPY